MRGRFASPCLIGSPVPNRPDPADARSADWPKAGSAARLHLRILATTDLHAHLLAWDYLADSPASHGLAQLAPLIRQARESCANCLLLDNGDFLQGSPLADWHDATAQGPHPMVTAMNALGYDAGTLGNHEFSFGLPRLMQALSAARFPVVSANLARSDGRPLAPRFAILHRDMIDSLGQSHRLRIAVIGFAPPQTTRWEALRLNGSLTAQDILAAAATVLDDLRAHKPDLTIALAHTGHAGPEPAEGMENAALPLAALPGIDALVTGHTHLVFPAPAMPGELAGKPAVMPGFFGSHLGQIDLVLARNGAGWHVTTHDARARPAPATPRSDAALANAAGPAHRATLDWMRAPLGHLTAPMHSHFALIAPCATTRLVAVAQRMHWQDRLPPDLAHLPLLSAVAPFRTGGRGGPQNVTDIPAGPLQRRHVADLYAHPNMPVLLCLTGAEIADWLERAAILFHRIAPDSRDTPLIRPEIPGFDFDMIDGLSFRIDLAAPPRFDVQGLLADPAARRIHGLSFAGRPIRPDDRYLLATNSYRAGSAVYPGTRRPPVAIGDTPIRDLLAQHIARLGSITPDRGAGWSFLPMPGCSVTFDACPTAAAHTADIASFRPSAIGPTEQGFLRFRLSL